MIPCPDCGSFPRAGETECRDCGSLIPEAKPESGAPSRSAPARASTYWTSESSRPAPALVAILEEDDPEPDSDGGPTFAGPTRMSRPAGPPGVHRLTANRALGPITPEKTRAKTRRLRRARSLVIGLLVPASLVAGGYRAYPRVRALLAARSVPADLRGYVKGKGVAYAPAGQGYSVRLPKHPVRRDGLLTASDARLSMFVHRSIASSGDYRIVIRVGDVPSGTGLPHGVVSALGDPHISGTATPDDARRLEFAGQVAYDYDLQAEPRTRGRIFFHDARLYVITVQSKSVDTVFDTVVKSFRLSK